MKKICSRCKKSKPISKFPFRNKKKGIYHSYCLECGRKWVKKHYSQNDDFYVQKAKQRRNKIIEALNQKIYNYLLENPCVDCGENDPIVLEFDHVRGIKRYNVSEMCYRLVSWELIAIEISKCDVRCANCHRRKTAKGLNWYRYKFMGR